MSSCRDPHGSLFRLSFGGVCVTNYRFLERKNGQIGMNDCLLFIIYDFLSIMDYLTQTY